MTPQEILQEAAKTLEQRSGVYGSYEESLDEIARYWRIYCRGVAVSFTPHDVAVMLALMKIARLRASSEHTDNYIDIAGYAALAGGLSGTVEDKR